MKKKFTLKKLKQKTMYLIGIRRLFHSDSSTTFYVILLGLGDSSTVTLPQLLVTFFQTLIVNANHRFRTTYSNASILFKYTIKLE